MTLGGAPVLRNRRVLPRLSFVQAGHQIDKIARSRAVVELFSKQAIPGGPAGSRGAWQTENISAVGNTGEGARLQARCSDLFEGERTKDFSEPFDPFVE